jgi:hypothetical protein
MHQNLIDLAVESNLLNRHENGGNNFKFPRVDIEIEDIEQFAKLIIHQCAEIAKNKYFTDTSVPAGPCAYWPILQYFGEADDSER